MPKARIHPERTLTPAEKMQRYRQRQAEARQAALLAGAPAAPAIATMPGNARWNAIIDQARSALAAVVEEMQSYYDDRSEEWQEGERAEALQERIDALEEVIETLQDV